MAAAMYTRIPIDPFGSATLTLPPNASVYFIAENLTTLFSFIVFQVHGFDGDVRLGTDRKLLPASRHAGFVYALDDEASVASCIVVNPNPVNSVNFLLLSSAHYNDEPVPGGCSQDFILDMVPELLPTLTSDLSTLRIGLPNANIGYRRSAPHQPLCEEKNLTLRLQYSLYGKFMNKRPDDAESFFSEMTAMRTANTTLLNARQVCQWNKSVADLPQFSVVNWRGHPIVYTVIVTDSWTGGMSSYVSFIVIGCDVSNLTATCQDIASLVDFILLGIVCLLGIIMCFNGHGFFKLEQFVIGFTVSGMLTCILVLRFANLEFWATWLLTVIVGCIFGALWLSLWWIRGMPLPHVFAALLMLGFVIACVVSYFGFVEYYALKMDVLSRIVILYNHDVWSILRDSSVDYILAFCIVMLFVVAVLLYWTKTANIVACAVTGSFAVMCACSIFMGGTIHYVLVRAIDRFTNVLLQEGTCFIAPLFTTDIILLLVWAVLSLVGVSCQFYFSQNRAPFPPCPRTTGTHRWLMARLRRHTDTEPLLEPTEDQAVPSMGYGTSNPTTPLRNNGNDTGATTTSSLHDSDQWHSVI